jgi:FlgD Ig-like domain/FG-GAP-like repeat
MNRIIRPLLLAAAVCLLASTAEAGPVNFTRIVLDTNFPGSVFPNIRHPVDVEAVDLDGDTDLDLVVSVTHLAGTGEGIYWYENDGAFAFTKTLIDTMLLDVDIDGVRFDVADINDDLDPDIVLCGANRVYLYSNDGSGSFTRTIIEATTASVRLARIADLDGDLDEDVAMLANGGLFWLQNDGSETFTRYPIDANPVVDLALAVVDLDGDGDADVVSSTVNVPSGDRYFTWYEAIGGGSFLYHIFDVLQGSETVTNLFVADVDRDGRLDHTWANFDDDTIWWYEDIGGHIYTAYVVTLAFNAPTRVWVSDLDNDSDRDVIAVGGNGGVGQVAYWEKSGTSTFTYRPVDITAGNREGLFVVDIDENSLPDLFVTDRSPGELVWYKNLGTGTGVGDTPDAPRVQVYPNVPNPFNPSTTIGFEVSPAGGVDVDVFSPAGVKVRTLVHESLDAGYHEVRWDGRDDAGRRVASGVYIARVRSHGVSRTHKMVLLM